MMHDGCYIAEGYKLFYDHISQAYVMLSKCSYVLGCHLEVFVSEFFGSKLLRGLLWSKPKESC